MLPQIFFLLDTKNKTKTDTKKISKQKIQTTKSLTQISTKESKQQNRRKPFARLRYRKNTILEDTDI